jgi:DNA polymerase
MGTEAALAAIAAEVRGCTRCPLHRGRTNAVPGEGNPLSDVLLVGEGPGAREDATGRPFVGPAGQLLNELLSSLGWARQDVFIANVVKCRPPGNRDPEPDEVSACAGYLERQEAALDPAVIVTLGRHSMGRFMPGVRISQAHGTTRLADPATGARDATVVAMYHPAAALRTPAIERESYEDVALIPGILTEARARRTEHRRAASAAAAPPAATPPAATPPAPAASAAQPQPATLPLPGPTPPDGDPPVDQLTIF